jgi:hypothetical protein
MTEDQKAFLADEFFSMTFQATLQRSLTYAEEVGELRKAEFREGLRRKLEEISANYRERVLEQDHFDNIETLADSLSQDFADCLNDARFRIGSAQKALNLYLKYLWCIGEVSEPPHCPFDNTVIGMLGLTNAPNWTSMDTIAEYRTLVEAANRIAGDRPLCVWELQAYNNA